MYVYADNAATTPMSETAFNAMKPWLTKHYGNPSSLYRIGREAKMALNEARTTVGKCLNAAMPVNEANDCLDLSAETDIQGYDIDGEIIRAARANAQAAGVDHLIHFQRRPVSELSHPKKYGFIVTNPPYGERLEEKKNLPELYRTFGERFAALDSWSAYVITAYEDMERYFGRKAAKNRKIYNGMMKTYFYQFPGPKPPSRARQG